MSYVNRAWRAFHTLGSPAALNEIVLDKVALDMVALGDFVFAG